MLPPALTPPALTPRSTLLVGQNGTGKSTLVEAVAAAWHGSLTGAGPALVG